MKKIAGGGRRNARKGRRRRAYIPHDNIVQALNLKFADIYREFVSVNVLQVYMR